MVSARTAPIVTLLSDFGLSDGYVAAVKGVLLSRCPAARLVDVSHEIPAGDVAAGAFVLAQAARHFPAGAVHLAVVDPGVGSARRAVACQVGDAFFVAPDNGLLSRVLPPLSSGAVQAHSLEARDLWREPVSPVFHGRDVFAPVAAHLAGGGRLMDAGPPLDLESLVCLEWPRVEAAMEAVRGCVVHVDRFGNLVTNLDARSVRAEAGEVEIAQRFVPVLRTYSDAPPGALLALTGSEGLIEVACNGGDAAKLLGVQRNDVVTWRPTRD